MAIDHVRSLLERQKQAWEVKSRWDGMLSEAYRFALPQRNLYQGAGSEQGQEKMRGVYSSTGIQSLTRAANRIQSDLMPPFIDWATLAPGPFVPEQFEQEARKRLDVINRTMFGAIHASNFATAVNELLLELLSGQGNMLVLEGDDEDLINHISVPDAQLAYDEGPFGRIDGKFRRVPVKPRNLLLTWPDAKNLPQDLAAMISDPGRQNEDVMLLELTVFDARMGNWFYGVIKAEGESGSAIDGELIVERRFTSDPWITPRWMKVPGEVRGRGPLLTALPDIRTENAVMALVLKQAAMAISGMWVAADDGVLNPDSVVIAPGAVVKARSVDSFRRVDIGGRFDIAQIVLEDLRVQIRAALFDQSLPPESGAVRSATEIVERIKALQQDIGSPFGRLMQELIVPYLTRALDILARKKVIDTPVKINGLTVQAIVTSPLAQAQKLNDLQAAVQAIQITQGIQPELVMLGFKVEKLPAFFGEKLGIDPDLLRGEGEQKMLQKLMGQLAAQQGGAALPAAQGRPNGSGLPRPEAVAVQ
jgi:hypothetical protein